MVPWIWAEIVRLVSWDEQVELFIPEGSEKAIRGMLDRAGADCKSVSLYSQSTNRVWMRDAGGIFVKDPKGKKTLLDWRFNAWAKYGDWQLDDALPKAMAKIRGLQKSCVVQPHFARKRVVLEGGAIDGNGAGVLLTTRECLLSKVQERNRGFDQANYEAMFKEYLGISKVIWLEQGIEGDDTHGHVDDLARFVGPNTVVLVVEKDKTLPNHGPLFKNLEILKGEIMPSGRPLEIIPLPMPRPVVFRGQVLPASYANFILTNSSVLVPTFHDEADSRALGILADCFPGRKVIGVHARDLVWGLGTLHCLSQQEPD